MGHDVMAAGAVPVRHPLGFLCFPIHRATAFGVCLHVWSDNLDFEPPTTSQVHAHSWDLLSYVVTGEIRNDIIAVVPDPGAATHRLCTIHPSDDGDQIKPTEQLVSHHLVSSENLSQGQFYTLATGLFHTTTALRETVTIAMAENQYAAPELSLASISTRPHTVMRRPGGPADIKIAARILGVEQ
ncbi:hypothetical protein [Herbidospora sp. RD11066]